MKGMKLKMNRIRLQDRILPSYTKGEEIFNMTSHIVGATLGIVALVLCVVFAAIHGNSAGVVSGVIYGITMIILYTMSSIYHGLKPEKKAKKVFQILDHCSIFLLIAGSYTPFCLVTFREYNPVLGWTIFGIIWGIAILGIVLNSIDIKKFKVFSMICYLGMGWCIIFTAKLLPSLLGIPGLVLLVAGGVAYSIGAILYGFGKKKKYMHSVFHLFILLGSILQFFCILLYVM
jgi:hemolysin III